MTTISNPGGYPRLVNTHTESQKIIKSFPSIAREIIERLIDENPSMVGENPYATGINLIKRMRGIK